jgi:hypothetical protein
MSLTYRSIGQASGRCRISPRLADERRARQFAIGRSLARPGAGRPVPAEPVHLTLRRAGGAIRGTVHWNRERHDLGKLERLLSTCQRILESLSEKPRQRIFALPGGEFAS